jgi:hypothetical protein
MVREDRSIGSGIYCRRSNAEIVANVRELRVISHSDRTFASAQILSPSEMPSGISRSASLLTLVVLNRP